MALGRVTTRIRLASIVAFVSLVASACVASSPALAVGSTPQTVTFGNNASFLNPKPFGAVDFTPATYSASSGLPVTLSVDPASSGVCSVVAGKIHTLGVGQCTLTASQAGNDTYAAASKSRTYTISKGSLTITATVSKVSYFSDESAPKFSFSVSGLANGDSVAGATYNITKQGAQVLADAGRPGAQLPTQPGYYRVVPSPTLTPAQSANYDVTAVTASYCLKNASLKSATGLIVCLDQAGHDNDVTNLNFNWAAGASQAGIASGFLNVAASDSFKVCSHTYSGATTFWGAVGTNVSSSSGPTTSGSASNFYAAMLHVMPTSALAVSQVFNPASGGIAGVWKIECTRDGLTYSVPAISAFKAFISGRSTPEISKVSPSGFSYAGGTTLTIEGSGFVKGATVSTGEFPCLPVTFVSATKLTCKTFARPNLDVYLGAKDLTVQNPLGGVGVMVGGVSISAVTGKPTSVTAPVVTGAAPSGDTALDTTLTSDSGVWDFKNDPTTSADIQWQVCSSTAPASCTNIANATGATFVASSAVAGRYLRSSVTATNDAGTLTVASNIVGPVAKANQTISLSSSVPTRLASGKTQALSAADKLGVGAVTFTATPAAAGVTCTVTKANLKVIGAGVCNVTVAIAADANYYAATSAVVAITVVDKAMNLTLPGLIYDTFDNSIYYGTVVLADAGTWNLKNGSISKTTYQWQACSTTAVASCRNLAGSTDNFIIGEPAIAGKYLRAIVTITTEAGVATATSALTSAPVEKP